MDEFVAPTQLHGAARITTVVNMKCKYKYGIRGIQKGSNNERYYLDRSIIFDG